MYSRGQIQGFLHLYIGEEAVTIGAMQALTPRGALFLAAVDRLLQVPSKP